MFSWRGCVGFEFGLRSFLMVCVSLRLLDISLSSCWVCVCMCVACVVSILCVFDCFVCCVCVVCVVLGCGGL